MDEDERFKEVLGPLFDELSKLDNEGMTIREILASKELKQIENTTYVLQMPVGGKVALDLASALEHWVTEQCEECTEFLLMFTTQFVMNLWDTIMISLEEENE